VLEWLNNVDYVVYGMGSLFTSICPSLVKILNIDDYIYLTTLVFKTF